MYSAYRIHKICCLNSLVQLPKFNLEDDPSLDMITKLGRSAHLDVFFITKLLLSDTPNSRLAYTCFLHYLPSRYGLIEKFNDIYGFVRVVFIIVQDSDGWILRLAYHSH